MIPADAQLTARDEALPAWESLPENLKRFYAARQMEVYAGFSENADDNVGRPEPSQKDPRRASTT